MDCKPFLQLDVSSFMNHELLFTEPVWSGNQIGMFNMRREPRSHFCYLLRKCIVHLLLPCLKIHIPGKARNFVQSTGFSTCWDGKLIFFRPQKWSFQSKIEKSVLFHMAGCTFFKMELKKGHFLSGIQKAWFSPWWVESAFSVNKRVKNRPKSGKKSVSLGAKRTLFLFPKRKCHFHGQFSYLFCLACGETLQFHRFPWSRSGFVLGRGMTGINNTWLTVTLISLLVSPADTWSGPWKCGYSHPTIN